MREETPEEFLARIRSMSSATYKPSGAIYSGNWRFFAHHGYADPEYLRDKKADRLPMSPYRLWRASA